MSLINSYCSLNDKFEQICYTCLLKEYNCNCDDSLKYDNHNHNHHNHNNNHNNNHNHNNNYYYDDYDELTKYSYNNYVDYDDNSYVRYKDRYIENFPYKHSYILPSYTLYMKLSITDIENIFNLKKILSLPIDIISIIYGYSGHKLDNVKKYQMIYSCYYHSANYKLVEILNDESREICKKCNIGSYSYNRIHMFVEHYNLNALESNILYILTEKNTNIIDSCHKCSSKLKDAWD
jgi:hypothetical protein